MALLIFLMILEKNQDIQPPMLREIKCLRKIRKDYFEPLVQTIEAGFASIAEDEKKQPHAADAFHVRKMSLQVLKD